jgi:hypothetical protein
MASMRCRRRAKSASSPLRSSSYGWLRGQSGRPVKPRLLSSRFSHECTASRPTGFAGCAITGTSIGHAMESARDTSREEFTLRNLSRPKQPKQFGGGPFAIWHLAICRCIFNG